MKISGAMRLTGIENSIHSLSVYLLKSYTYGK